MIAPPLFSPLLLHDVFHDFSLTVVTCKSVLAVLRRAFFLFFLCPRLPDPDLSVLRAGAFHQLDVLFALYDELLGPLLPGSPFLRLLFKRGRRVERVRVSFFMLLSSAGCSLITSWSRQATVPALPKVAHEEHRGHSSLPCGVCFFSWRTCCYLQSPWLPRTGSLSLSTLVFLLVRFFSL